MEIALLEDKRLVELHHEKADASFAVGDLYLGKVKKLIPGLNAAAAPVLDTTVPESAPVVTPCAASAAGRNRNKPRKRMLCLRICPDGPRTINFCSHFVRAGHFNYPPTVVDAYLAFAETGDLARLDEVVLGVEGPT